VKKKEKFFPRQVVGRYLSGKGCGGQQLMDCAYRRLAQGNLVAGLAVPDLADGHPEQVRGPQVGIDPQNKKGSGCGGNRSVSF
jgi:hypothetical protein